MKKKRAVTILALAAVGLALCYGIVGNPRVWFNNQRLNDAIKSVRTDTICFNELVPFEWDRVYDLTQNPGPYAGREDIEELIGFRSRDIETNQISRGMMHLLFVKDQKVVACVLGYPENLGYGVSMDSSLSCGENAWFRVVQDQGVTWLTNGPEP